MVTGPNPRRSRQRHLSSSTVDRPHLAFTQRISALPSSLQALDLHLSVRMDIPSALASLRTHVLSYLSDLEARLALLDFQSSVPKSPTDSKFNETESAGEKSDHPDVQLRDLDLSVEDIGAFVQQGVELLQSIRADVCSYLPDDFDFGASTSHALRNRLLDFDVRSKFPDFGMPTMGHLRSRLSEISPTSPLSYIPTLKAHLSRLQIHLQNHPFSTPSNRTFPLPSISPPKVLSELFAILLQEDTEEAIEEDIKKARQEEETMHEQVKRALVKSQHGYRLIRFEDLPHKWRNNEFVHTGYRCVYNPRSG
jgi:adiponectin receptor